VVARSLGTSVADILPLAELLAERLALVELAEGDDTAAAWSASCPLRY